VDARVEFSDQVIVNAELQYSENGILNILADPNRTAPDQFDNADRLIRTSPFKLRFTFRGKRGQKTIPRRPEAALLRIAYLQAFSVFGYGFLINFGAKAMRSQFRNPDERILPSWGVSRSDSIPDEALGINLISAPHELRSFLSVFDLVYGEFRHRYCVHIPGPTNPGTKIYSSIEKYVKTKRSVELKLISTPKDIDFLNTKGAEFVFHDLWKELSQL
jgi:hypothetical protein